MIYRVDQRWVKNNRDPENTVYGPSLFRLPLPLLTKSYAHRYGASTGQHGTLLYDDTQYLLALALADNAICGIDNLDDLWQLQIPDGDEELLLRWNDSVRELPILRNATMQRGITEEPLPKWTFDRTLKAVLNLSGYFGKATVHAIRRYLGKKVNSQWAQAA